tara:strand:+ start:57 stop:254 length:198 start_codon:yes stop_codon:yes gene_type:complete
MSERNLKLITLAGWLLMGLAGVLQFEVLKDLYITPKEEMAPLLVSGGIGTLGLVMIMFGTEEPDQ